MPSKLEKRIKELEERITLLGAVQVGIVNHFADKDEELQASIMASIFSVDELLNDFTSYINHVGDDDTKAFMMYMNEIRLDMDRSDT